MSNRAVLLLSVAALASAASVRAADPLLPLLGAEFGVSAGAASIVITAFGISYGLLQVVFAPLSDRFGKYFVVCVTTLVSAIGTLACALAPSLEWLAIARFASGATVGAIIPLSMAWIGDTVKYEERQAVLARFLLGQIAGVAVGQMAAGIIGEHFGWRWLFVLLSVMYAVTGALLLAESRRNPATRHAPPPGAARGVMEGFVRIGGLLRRPKVRKVLLTITPEGMLMYGALSFVPAHLQLHFGVSPTMAGSIAACVAVGGATYAFLARHFISALGERGLVLGGGTALGTGFMLLALAPAAWVAAAGLVFIGCGYYMLHNTLQTHATQMAPEARGAALALFAMTFFSAQSFGVWLGAKVVDSFGAPPLFAASSLGLFTLGLMFSRQTKKRQGAAGA
jgi:predicted MFS family arabinose efflux permease